jgi:hypothetical protein
MTSHVAKDINLSSSIGSLLSAYLSSQLKKRSNVWSICFSDFKMLEVVYAAVNCLSFSIFVFWVCNAHGRLEAIVGDRVGFVPVSLRYVSFIF